MLITQIIIWNHYKTQLSKQLSMREIISRCITSYSMKCSIFIVLAVLASCDWSNELYIVLSILQWELLLVQIRTDCHFWWCKYQHVWAHASHSYSVAEKDWTHQNLIQPKCYSTMHGTSCTFSWSSICLQ